MNNTSMIVEADPFIARLLKRFAEESRLEPVASHTGQDVIALARQTVPAVIVLDADLPRTVRGRDIIQPLLDDQETVSFPIILAQ